MTGAERERIAGAYAEYVRRRVRSRLSRLVVGQYMMLDPDAVQVIANQALFHAVMSYDPRRNVGLAWWLSRCARGAVADAVKVWGRRPPPKRAVPVDRWDRFERQGMSYRDWGPEQVDTEEAYAHATRDVPERTRAMLDVLRMGGRPIEAARAVGLSRSRVSRILQEIVPEVAARLVSHP